MNVRKIVTVVEEIRTEGGREVWPPARIAVVAAVIENPWAGQGFVEDLTRASTRPPPTSVPCSRRRCWTRSSAPAEAYGKAAIVGPRR